MTAVWGEGPVVRRQVSDFVSDTTGCRPEGARRRMLSSLGPVRVGEAGSEDDHDEGKVRRGVLRKRSLRESSAG